MSGVTFRAGSTGGIGDTIAVGLVSYFDEIGVGHVLNNGFWMPAKEDPTGWSMVSIGGIDIFVGFTAKALDDLGFTSSLPPPTLTTLKTDWIWTLRRLPIWIWLSMQMMTTPKMTQPLRGRRRISTSSA